jgi:hypothetical protein
MPRKHAASHFLATLIGTIAAGLLVELAKSWLPSLQRASDRFSDLVAGSISDLAGVHLDPRVVSVGLLAAFLAGIWGMFFAFMHSDSRD